MTARLARGTVARVRFDPTEGREMRKTRPAIVISNDAACRFDAVVQVVPVMHAPDRDLRPYEARCGSRESGLVKPSRAVANRTRWPVVDDVNADVRVEHAAKHLQALTSPHGRLRGSFMKSSDARGPSKKLSHTASAGVIRCA